MNHDGVFYFFVHILVKLGRAGHDVDCWYTSSELSVKLTGEEITKFLGK